MIEKTLGAQELALKANEIRDSVFKVSLNNNAGHIAPSMSCIDILVALYYRELNYDFSNPLWPDRDRLVFSKAHGCYGLYAIFADMGLIPKNEWEAFYTPSSSLLGCMERRPDLGIEAGCGSLGHGLPLAVGMAFAAKLREKTFRVFCIIGDGEMQEGSNWEAIQFAVKHKLNNLIIVVDCNGLQAMDFLVNILDKEVGAVKNRLKGFDVQCFECAGHDMGSITSCFQEIHRTALQGPAAILANTIKGHGMKCMENIPKFHFRVPNDDEIKLGKTYG